MLRSKLPQPQWRSLVIKVLALTIASVLAMSTIAEAKPSHRGSTHGTYHSSHRGACDGFHGCVCGTTAARNFGISYAQNGWNLKQAREWRRFPRVGFQPGVAGVQEHHVLQIVGGSSCANATVRDETGTYNRNVCNMTFHSVTGGGLGAYAQAPPSRGRTHTFSARSRHVEAPAPMIFERHASY